MSIAEEMFDKAQKAGKVSDGSKYFSVTKKVTVMVEGEEMVVEKPNGNHHVKVLSEKIGKGKDFQGNEVDQLQLTILDNGIQKLWNVPLKNQDGTLYFLIEKLKEINYLDGEEFVVQAKKLKSGKYSKEIIKVGAEESIPTIQLDEDASAGDSGELPPLTPPEKEIDPADIPF